MADYAVIGFEVGSVVEYFQNNASGGTASIQGTVKRTGDSALMISCTTTQSAAAVLRTQGQGTSNLNIATAYTRFYIYIETLPSADNEEIFSTNTGGAYKFSLRINSTGNLMAFDTAQSQLGSDGTTTLSLNTWYRIEAKVGTGAAAAYEVQIEGNIEFSGTGNLNATNNNQVMLGKNTNRNGETVKFYYDDVRISDSGFPGPGRIGRCDIDGDGLYTDFTIGAGVGDKWQQIIQTPPDNDTTYLLSTSTVNQAYTGTLETASSAGISGVIRAVQSIVICRGNGSFSGTAKQRLRSAATNSDSASFGGMAAATYGLWVVRYTTDPNTGAAWTLAALDNLELGVIENTALDRKTRVTLACLMVDYIEAGEYPVETGPDDTEEAGDGTGFSSNGVGVTIESAALAPNRKNAAFRFPHVYLPIGSRVVTATLKLQASDTIDDDLDSDVYGEDADNSADFTTNPSINSRSRTDAVVEWSIDAAGTNTVSSPNLATIVQEIKSRAGWSSGNAITIFVFGKTSGSKKFKAKSFETVSGSVATLTLTYEFGGPQTAYMGRIRLFAKSGP